MGQHPPTSPYERTTQNGPARDQGNPLPVGDTVAERHATRPRLYSAQTRTLVSTFVAAFNRGDQRAINNLWASKVSFKWYSVTTEPGARTPQDSMRRDKLLPYLATRHSANEQLSITNLKINGVSGGGYQNFEFRLMRSADDLPTAWSPTSARRSINAFHRTTHRLGDEAAQ